MDSEFCKFRLARFCETANELRARWHELLRRQGSRWRRDELGADRIANRLANNLLRLRSQLASLMAEAPIGRNGVLPKGHLNIFVSSSCRLKQ
jgi:hypothetical protein